ncbi:unnamed protein product, partial [Meganyctiphanes norvegica]
MRFSYGRASRKIHDPPALWGGGRRGHSQLQQNFYSDLLQQNGSTQNKFASRNSKSQQHLDLPSLTHQNGGTDHQDFHLIRISPKLIRKQVQHTTKYRPIRSL